jgi:hypothetical protein
MTEAETIANAVNEMLRQMAVNRDRIEQLEAALQKYADEEYNGYNACGKHARATLEGGKTNDAAT